MYRTKRSEQFRSHAVTGKNTYILFHILVNKTASNISVNTMIGVVNNFGSTDNCVILLQLWV